MSPHANVRNSSVSLVVLVAISFLAAWPGSAAAQKNSGTRAPAHDALTPLDVRQVKVGGEIGRRIDVTIENNLLKLDLDGDFLGPFRKRDQTGGYVGLGKTIDAAVRLAAYSGDEQVVALKKHLVEETIRTQEDDGYIGIIKPDRRVFALWDIHEMGYIVYGLVTDYRLFDEKHSLEAARKLADYIIRRWTAEPDREPGGGHITVRMAVTGLEAAMLALADATGDQRYRRFCTDFRKLPEWNARIVTGRWGQIEGHAYAHVCRCLAQLRLYRTTHDPRLLRPTSDVLEFLTAGDGLVITGACGDHECWHDTQEGTINLAETCATAYLVRFLGERMLMTGGSGEGHIIERAVYNALFAAQSPDGRQIRYYTPFDGPRTYHPGDTYCCPCNYRRIVAELPGMIYYRTRAGGPAAEGPDGILVSLYTASQATVELDDGLTVRLRQQTDYPSSGKVVLHVDPSRPAEFPLRLRFPAWCDTATLSIAGGPAEEKLNDGKALQVHRRWQPGDKLTVDFAMPFRLVKGRKAQAGRVAVMRGPQVFCLNPANNEGLEDVDLRLLTLDPASVEGPVDDDSVRPGGVSCRAKAWGPGKWYPSAKPELTLTLTEFPDPGGEAVYFKVPNPNTEEFVDDELLSSRLRAAPISGR